MHVFWGVSIISWTLVDSWVILESILLHVCKYGKKLIPTRWMGAEIILHFDTRFIFGFLLSLSFLCLQTFPVKMQIISILGSADYPVSVSTTQLYHSGVWRQPQMIHKQWARLCPSKLHVQNQVVGGIRPLSCVCWPRSTCITASGATAKAWSGWPAQVRAEVKPWWGRWRASRLVFFFLARLAFPQLWGVQLECCCLMAPRGRHWRVTLHAFIWPGKCFPYWRSREELPVERIETRAHIPHCFHGVVSLWLPLKVTIISLKALHLGQKKI